MAACFSGRTDKIPPTERESKEPLGALARELGNGRNEFESGLSNGEIGFSTHAMVSPSPGVDVGRINIPRVVTGRMAMPMRMGR